jgi:hypothetical protein
MDHGPVRKVEVVSVRNGNSWAVMVGGRQAVVVTRREAALQIAEEITAYGDRDAAPTSRDRPRSESPPE